VALVVVAAAFGWIAYDRFFVREIPTFASDADHFKYGSIGNDGETGLPYPIWRALPKVFPEHLPGPGGYSSLGLRWEAGRDHEIDAPVGASKARVGVERIAINCAFCHFVSVRTAAGTEPTIVEAGAGNTIDVLGYQRFLMRCASDPRFTADVLLPVIEQDTQLSWLDRLLYRFVLIPITRKRLLEQKEEFAWTERRPEWGPGRIDPFNPVKFGMLGLEDDGTIGNSDMQAVWNLGARERIRANAPLHWDGLSTSLHEVVLSSALGDGATAKEFDFASMDRIERFLQATVPPPSPYRPDGAAVERGKALYVEHCAECHAADGTRTLTIVPVEEVGTDPHRAEMWTDAARDAYNGYREGYDWGFRSFQNVEGYVAEPLQGLWLGAPYLHNGSVPTLADLLAPPEARPRAFVRGLEDLDPERGGFVAPACDPRQKPEVGFCYDVSQPGNYNGGHNYGTGLGDADRADLLAYLKTL
jgi:mono/diheme cytochrome c family protein